jgi:hypothetical protein
MQHQRLSPSYRQLRTFRNKASFYGEELLATRPTPKLEDHPLSAFRDCLFSIFGTTVRIGRSIRKLRTRHAVATGTHYHCACVCVYTHTHVRTYIHTQNRAPGLRLFVLPLLFFNAFCQFTPPRNLLLFLERHLACCAVGRQPLISDGTISWHIFYLRLVELVFTSATGA